MTPDELMTVTTRDHLFGSASMVVWIVGAVN